MPGEGINAPKKRNKGKVDEIEQRRLSTSDAYILFGASFISSLPDFMGDRLINWLYLLQNCRHYTKICGDGTNGFDLIRSPMYKYNKEAKEKLLRDDIMAFLWAYFRISNSPQDVINEKNDEEPTQ